jgi:nitrite reductase/ring-hydroxylating ferredoxin subunit
MEKESDINRRKFMEIGIYTITGTIAAVSGVALARFAVGSSFDKKQSKWIELNPEDVQEAAEGFARVVLEYEQKDGWLTATSHLGCIVTWDEEKKIFQCPCHDGRYDMEGRVISGPPPGPLKRHKTKIEDGKIFLATETVPYGGDSHEPA